MYNNESVKKLYSLSPEDRPLMFLPAQTSDGKDNWVKIHNIVKRDIKNPDDDVYILIHETYPETGIPNMVWHVEKTFILKILA